MVVQVRDYDVTGRGWEMVGFSIHFENRVDRLLGVWEREKSKATPGFSAQRIRSMVVPFSELRNITETGVLGGTSPVLWILSLRCLSDIQVEC